MEDSWVSLRDVADLGFYVYSPEVFAPDASGEPPRIRLEIDDLKKLGRVGKADIPSSVVARIWNDFLPYACEPLTQRSLLARLS